MKADKLETNRALLHSVYKVIHYYLNTFQVNENRPAGSFVGHVTVDDPDSGDGGMVDCELTDGADLLSMSRLQMPTSAPSPNKTGNGDVSGAGFPSSSSSSKSTVYLLTTRRPLDREMQAEHAAAIVCRDRGRLPAGPLSTELPFAVRVVDDNDNPPAFVQSTYSVNVRENGTASPRHPMPILRVRATDHDEGDNAHVTYRLATEDERHQDGGNDDVIESARSNELLCCVKQTN